MEDGFKFDLSTDLKILDFSLGEEVLSIPYRMKINYDPPIGRIILKGVANVKDNYENLEKIEQNLEENNSPDNKLVREIVKQNLTEAAIISKSLNIPSPIPAPGKVKRD